MSWLPSTGGGGADPQTAVNTADIATIEGEQTTQDGLIAANTAKVSYTDSAQVSTNTSNIATNASGVSSNATTAFNLGTDVAGHHSRLATIDSDQVTQDSAIALNTAKTGITSGQASAITANSAKVSYDDTEAAAATAAITTLQGEQTTQDSAIALNTAKTGITSGQASEITVNTAKVSYTDAAIVATAIQPADTVADLAPIPATTQSGTTYTLALSDVFSTVMLSNAALVTVTVPTNASVAFPTGTQIALQSLGAGGVTLTTTSLSLNGSSPDTTIAQNEIMVLEKTATDTWSVYGGTSA